MSPLIVAVVVGAITFCAVRVALGLPRRGWIRGRIEPYVGVRQVTATVAAPVTESRPSWLARLDGLFAATDRRFGGTRLWRYLQRLVEQADVGIRPAELFYLAVGVGVVLGLVVTVVGGAVVALIVLPVCTLATACGFLAAKAARRRRAFDDQLPDLLTELAATLRVGYSLTQALDSVAEGAAEPAAKELRRALAEARLGRPFEDALADVGSRVGSRDLDFVLNAVAVQRQVGGSLAALFDIVADTVRRRHQFVRKLRSLTAMGRLSAYVLLALPVSLGGLLTVLDRPYMEPLYRTGTGHLMLLVGLGMMTVGALAMTKIVSIKG